VLTAAADLAPPSLRSLDAIHVVTAGALGASISAHDQRLLDATRGHDLVTISPQ
jgi:hypothetical protein